MRIGIFAVFLVARGCVPKADVVGSNPIARSATQVTPDADESKPIPGSMEFTPKQNPGWEVGSRCPSTARLPGAILRTKGYGRTGELRRLDSDMRARARSS